MHEGEYLLDRPLAVLDLVGRAGGKVLIDPGVVPPSLGLALAAAAGLSQLFSP
jgi:hypothetical protein